VGGASSSLKDEAVLALMLRDLLIESGCVVIGPTGHRTSALTLLEHEPIDCAVLDINLSTARRFLSLKP